MSDRSLENLKRGSSFPRNRHAEKHAGYSAQLLENVTDEVREVMTALGDSLPVRHESDLLRLETVARHLKGYRAVSAWLDKHGRLDGRGRPMAACNLEMRYANALERGLDDLGANPMARSRLGVNLGIAASLVPDQAEIDLADPRTADIYAEMAARVAALKHPERPAERPQLALPPAPPSTVPEAASEEARDMATGGGHLPPAPAPTPNLVDNINEVPGPEPAISGEVVDSGPPSRRGPVVVRYGDDVPVTDTFGNVVSDDELEAARRLHREPGLGLPLTFGLSLDDC